MPESFRRFAAFVAARRSGAKGARPPSVEDAIKREKMQPRQAAQQQGKGKGKGRDKQASWLEEQRRLSRSSDAPKVCRAALAYAVSLALF